MLAKKIKESWCCNILFWNIHENYIKIISCSDNLIFTKNFQKFLQKEWKDLLKRAKKNKLKIVLFTKEAQISKTYEEYIDKMKDRVFDSINIIGMGVVGPKEKVTSFSGDLTLLR
ncbi:MAG: hypothetical protein COY38_00475 [Candidatus Aenigmarchaeota archaeon CG_4_10_14_0_8_um_filter_37_24]|nr:DUF2000 domain-containing protein [Candidatus Aenigmarchaeota archaeon]PIV68330.1 MAG: hypothetical protein COS07_04405 [Candidatus Aenigmarchaeota archaeon CG01_land_8_20_14_3_00_37_9]PIW40926.1 MAG: hypothetical protein COW21_04635 [Candidatus Aenigmarchaeota archaeon CG15_BIG_FIL_POST_REV_8_21_14_020_37_27]PIX50302.1 MAG: hypothetical protein COZ52_04740 [Candidatus Aenigmarchaeota archaeon CG_4_8_14_3_um_filter_37_24]PIY35056.1 MAG: hypothetical protein COZ04_04710 [Candidatus Aenigmarch